jgi:PPK2 family polyphosphate:nucleotide phosphotransferase
VRNLVNIAREDHMSKHSNMEHDDDTPPHEHGSDRKHDYPSYRVEPGKPVRLADIDPADTGGYGDKDEIEDELDDLLDRLYHLQERLYAEQKQSLLVVLQAMDTGGKDGTIKGVFRGVNPQGCVVWAFKVPTEEEMAHDFLWRVHAKTPRKGQLTIFNRSHYEDVVVVRVKSLVPEEVWRARYHRINDFERLLATADTRVVKLYLHISRDEQKRRLQARLDNPDKHWKFAVGDIAERERWDDYMAAYEEAINRCTTEHAPWYVVPSNKKWYRNLVIARAIVDTLESMDPHFPEPEENLEGITIPD